LLYCRRSPSDGLFLCLFYVFYYSQEVSPLICLSFCLFYISLIPRQLRNDSYFVSSCFDQYLACLLISNFHVDLQAHMAWGIQGGRKMAAGHQPCWRLPQEMVKRLIYGWPPAGRRVVEHGGDPRDTFKSPWIPLEIRVCWFWFSPPFCHPRRMYKENCTATMKSSLISTGIKYTKNSERQIRHKPDLR
jgi:hypothetical protein